MKPSRSSSILRAIAVNALLMGVFGCDNYTPKERIIGYLSMPPAAIPECDATISIESDSRALVVTDSEVLSGLALEGVLEHLLSFDEDKTAMPLGMLQRLFDTANQDGAGAFDGIHCDSNNNPAHANGPAAKCPRNEGQLAWNENLLTPGHPDSFVPVAIVNRFDLTPLSAQSCGEYRIVYAKQSGLTDPEDRVFLIFEGAIPNPHIGSLLSCRPIALFWQSLAEEHDNSTAAASVKSFFLEGLPGFSAPISPRNLGVGATGGAAYYQTEGPITGQIRLSQHVGDFWEMRQFKLDLLGLRLGFVPVPVGNNPVPRHFAAFAMGQEATSSNAFFVDDFSSVNTELLAATKVTDLSMTISAGALAGESALGGSEINDYASWGAGNDYLHERLQEVIDSSKLNEGCPSEDPLTPERVLQRATMMSCAGCHAPEQFLGPERSLGCGLAFPASLGEVHINEKGELSPALKEVFLPKRASVLQTYLQACDEEAILEAFGGSKAEGQSVKSNRRQTLGGQSVH